MSFMSLQITDLTYTNFPNKVCLGSKSIAISISKEDLFVDRGGPNCHAAKVLCFRQSLDPTERYELLAVGCKSGILGFFNRG